jgi:aspartyl-tRNA(Asn)/glutamyl-tRNA(Gln) amidotransferase subunit A
VDEVRARLELIERRNGVLLALREVYGEAAMDRARLLETKRAQAASMPLFGVPVAIKDNLSEAGKPNRAGRRDASAGPVSDDSVIVGRLLAAGAIVMARANMDELAYGVSGSNPHTGQVRNPCNEKRHPGGSSAGSAAAVAAELVPLAIGTDTAGSVRIPSALCGVVGMRPTFGLVSSEGVAPLCPRLDSAGPIGRTVEDVALLLSVMADRPELATAATARSSLRSVKVAALEGVFAVEVDAGIRVLFEDACKRMEKLVASVQRASVEELAAGPRASGPVIGAEASHVWAEEFDAQPDWFGEEVAGHLTKGAAIKAVRYLRALDECSAVVRAIDGAFERTDVLMLPTTAIVATPAGAPGPQLPFLALTVPFSLGGYPAITVPMGESSGMPAGLQLVGKRGQDGLVLALAAAFC